MNTHKAQPPGLPAGELHVAGILVHAMPAHADSVAAWVSSLPGAFVHGAQDGKLVVTLEAPTTAAILDQLNRIRERASVLSALPVYQHNEPAGEIDEKDSYGY